jgi:hypothetical protein
MIVRKAYVVLTNNHMIRHIFYIYIMEKTIVDTLAIDLDRSIVTYQVRTSTEKAI